MTTSGDHGPAPGRSRRVRLGAGSGALVVAVIVAVVVAVVGTVTGPSGGDGDPRPTAAPAIATRVAPAEARGADDETAVGRSGTSVEAPSGPPDPATPALPAATPQPDGEANRPPTPTSWSQEVLAAEPGDEIRSAPQASDWTAENIVVGKDADGQFLGRVTVRYAGPGSARATFALAVLKQGEEIAVLTGELIEARAGVYQVLVHSPAGFVEGPWETRFQVLSTA